ncbi:SsrA-binding protein SmpB [Buchnera aphidicola]|uniref:SsrA-binding protein SmpB n=1 Tax=Buchnera aphidicola TaxID=9 RepID=UPI003463B7F7
MKKKEYLNNKVSIIVINKKAKYSYNIEEEYESGIILLGWEVKSIRSKKVNINGSYISLFANEAFLFSSTFEPLPTISTHVVYDPMRNRKLLLHKEQIYFLRGKVNREGYTLIALSLFWKKNWCKLKIGIGKGIKKLDKREREKKNQWQLDKNRILKNTKNKILF